jgi:hypothetical protein
MALVTQTEGVSKLEAVIGVLLLTYILVTLWLWIEFMPSPPQLPEKCYGPAMCDVKEGYTETMTLYLLLGLAGFAGIPFAVWGLFEELEYKREGQHA